LIRISISKIAESLGIGLVVDRFYAVCPWIYRIRWNNAK